MAKKQKKTVKEVKKTVVKKLSIVDSLLKKLDKKGWMSAVQRNDLLELKVNSFFIGIFIDSFEFESKEFPGTFGMGINLQDEKGKAWTYFTNAQLKKKIKNVPDGSEIFILRQPDNVVKKSKGKGKKSTTITYRNYLVRFKSNSELPY